MLPLQFQLKGEYHSKLLFDSNGNLIYDISKALEILKKQYPKRKFFIFNNYMKYYPGDYHVFGD